MVHKQAYGSGGILGKVLQDNSKYFKNKKTKKEVYQDEVFSQLYRYASITDIILMIIGTISALANGIMLPITSFIFGDLTSAFAMQEKYANDPRYKNNTPIPVNGIFSAYEKGSNSINNNSNSSVPVDFINQKVFLEVTNLFGFYFLYIGTFVVILSFVQTVCWESACCNQITKLRQIYFAQTLRQDIAWHDDKGNEDLTNKITDDMERMRDGLGSKVPVFFQSVSLLFSGLAVGFITSWRLTLIVLAGGPVLIIASTYTAKVGSAVAAREQLRYGVAGGIASEVLTSIRTIAAFCTQDWEFERYKSAVTEGKRLTMKKYYFLSVGMALSLGMIYIMYGIGLWYGGQLFLKGQLQPGELFTVFMSVVSGSLGIGNSLPNIIDIGTAIGSAAGVMDIIDNVPKIDPYSKEGQTIQNMKGDIEFKNVYFSYPTRPQTMVLSGLDLTIPAGKVVAVVGTSGAGKSTLVNLILRFYDPLCGKVCIDGNSTVDLNVQNLRQEIGVVSQEPALFDVTIEENIRYGKPDATKGEIEEAAKVAYAHAFIESLPKGYATKVGERGIQISGGQKQRIAIARALIRKPKLLLLDEATSALDLQSEGVVQEALNNASKGRTTLIIAHRLSTIRNADLIYAMKDGRVAECGQHNELMEKKGTYYNLVLAQSKEYEELEEPEKLEIIVNNQVENEDRCKSRAWNKLSINRLPSESTSSAEKHGDDVNYWRLLHISDSPWMIAITGVTCIIAGLHMPTFAFLYGGILGLFVLPEEEFKRQVMLCFIMFTMLGIATVVVTVIIVLASSSVTEDMIKELRIKTFKNILTQQISFFDDENNSPIKLTNILAKEPPLVKNIAGMRAGTILMTIVTTFLSLVIAFYCGWRIALIVLFFVPFIVFGNWVQMRMKFNSSVQESETSERVAKIASESLQNIKTVQLLCLQEHMLNIFTEELEKSHREERKQSYMFSVTFATVNATVFLMYGCTFMFGSGFVNSGYMTGKDIYRTIFALVFASTNLGSSALYFQDFGKAKAAITRVVKLMTIPTTLPLSEEGEKPVIKGNIRFKDIVFSYPSRKHTPILMGFNLDIPEGKTIALVGGSGCGKSTVIGLLERFYNPRKGHIYIDGMNIEKINVSYLRSQIGLVTQEPTLFDSSLKENIMYGNSSLEKQVTDDDIIAAAKVANIHEFIISLPEGYETNVGERGSKLSGGQKQRVAIARALIRNPKILLLDEATSALDTESEKVVQEALDNARQGRTSIVIAHRLSTVQTADLIAVVSEGKVAELGSHSELLELHGLYYNLVKSQ